MRRWVPVGLTLLAVLAAGCAREVVVSTEDALAATDHYGNIRVVDKWGIVYLTQSLGETDEGDYLLQMVKVVDDGVVDYLQEHTVRREDVVSISYYEQNRWTVIGLVTGTALFMVWLYYKLNTSVFD